jgi:23S rRNA pseudouridine2605 synthase
VITPLPRVFLFFKPRGALCSTVEEGGARTVFGLLPEPYRAWFMVGRLDKDSEGLLLFADDARWAQRLMDPGSLAKTYDVVVEGFPREETLQFMRTGGHVLDGRALRPAAVTRLGKAPRGGTRFRVTLHEGVNRQIRRLFLAAGHKVRRLTRSSVGPVTLGGLSSGEGRELGLEEVDEVVRTLGTD